MVANGYDFVGDMARNNSYGVPDRRDFVVHYDERWMSKTPFNAC